MPYNINWGEKKIMNCVQIRILKEAVLELLLWHLLGETEKITKDNLIKTEMQIKYIPDISLECYYYTKLFSGRNMI
jgi:hypothetical protein